MDQLSVILQRFSMNTEVFFTGNLCGISNFNREQNQGHLHLLRSGELTLIDERGKPQLINEPTVLFFPTPHAHRIIGSEHNPPELVCLTSSITKAPLIPSLMLCLRECPLHLAKTKN